MRVITYNLHKGVGKGRTSSLEEVAHCIAELAPDLLLLQEVFHGVADIVKQSSYEVTFDVVFSSLNGQ